MLRNTDTLVGSYLTEVMSKSQQGAGMHDLGASNVCDRRSFVARERRWSHRPLSLCRVCLSSQISILARCEIQILEAERLLAFVCDSVYYVSTSSVQFSPSSDLRRSSCARSRGGNRG